jgi:hypothetical protein
MSTMAGTPAYPARVEAQLDPGLSRWQWLFKWLFAVPHYLVLVFLWIAFGALSAVAFFAILFTGRYPRSIFDFNVGVLRWSWRVTYYAYGALGTDRYPPFTLAEVADYPAHFDVAYPEHLSRGLVLIKWWLLAIPHYLIVALFAGGFAFGWSAFHLAGGLISLLALVAGIVLAFTARYPEPVFDLVLGLNRWVLRVAAYAGLMTDEYPPFRLDLGGSELGGTMTLPSGPGGSPEPTDRPPPLPGPSQTRTRWGPGRVAAVVLGSILVLPSLGALAAGGTLLWADLNERDADGFINTDTASVDTSTYAVVSERIDLPDLPGWADIDEALGTVRLRVAPAGAEQLFVGIARTADVERYLAGVGHAFTNDLGQRGISRTIAGTSPPADPAAQTFWVASSLGPGTRVVTWRPQDGIWSAVAMNANRSRRVSVDVSVGATVPALRPIAIGLLAGGGLFFILSLALIVGAATFRGRRT